MLLSAVDLISTWMPFGVAGFPPVKLRPAKSTCAFGMLPTVRPSAEGEVKLNEAGGGPAAGGGSGPRPAWGGGAPAARAGAGQGPAGGRGVRAVPGPGRAGHGGERDDLPGPPGRAGRGRRG